MKKIHNGAFNFSKKTNVPIKIIATHGIEKIWPKGGHPSGYGTITIKTFDKLHYFKDREEYQDKVRNTIENYIKSSL